MSNLHELEEALDELKRDAHTAEGWIKRVQRGADEIREKLARVWPEEGLPATYCPGQVPVDEHGQVCTECEEGDPVKGMDVCGPCLQEMQIEADRDEREQIFLDSRGY